MMMLYGVYDRKAQVYGQPFIAENDDAAIRAYYSDFYRVYMDSPSSPFVMFPEDFDLCRIGTFDINSGVVASVQGVIPVIVPGSRLKKVTDDVYKRHDAPYSGQ